jgi:hypothetical protein
MVTLESNKNDTHRKVNCYRNALTFVHQAGAIFLQITCNYGPMLIPARFRAILLCTSSLIKNTLAVM